MESQKILNLVNSASSKFETRKWYVINDQNNTEYGQGNENDSSIKFETKVIKSNLCDYSDAYILVTRDVKVTAIGENTNVAFKNCAAFTRCVTHINDEHIDTSESLDIIRNMHNLLEYSGKYAHTSRSLWQFKRDEPPMDNAGDSFNFAINNSSSFKYKSSILGKATDAADNDRSLKNDH